MGGGRGEQSGLSVDAGDRSRGLKMGDGEAHDNSKRSASPSPSSSFPSIR